MQQARKDGYARGFGEARQFKSSVGGVFERQQALDWLRNVIDDGRSKLHSQHASEREIEAWDMSCRIAFMVSIVSEGFFSRLKAIDRNRLPFGSGIGASKRRDQIIEQIYLPHDAA